MASQQTEVSKAVTQAVDKITALIKSMAKKGADPSQEKYQKALTEIVRKVHHTKKAKDHTKPKIPMNSYICFNTKNREKFIVMHPDLPATEIAKIMSEEWKRRQRRMMKSRRSSKSTPG